MYFYIQNFSSLFEDNPSAMYDHRFINFEAMVQQCAATAVSETRRAWDNGKILSHEIDINLPLINKIIAAYKSSCFGKDLPDFYIRRVRDEFIFLAGTELLRSCHHQVHYDLILPVIFFRCIMLNEFNPDSVNNRVSELKDQLAKEIQDIALEELPENYFDNLQEDPKWIGRSSPWTKTYDSGDVLAVKLYQFEENERSFRNIVSEAEKLAIEAKFDTNIYIPPAVRIACNGFFHLKDKYEIVKSCSEYARVGCFLYDLLAATANDAQILDTILRLYMIAEVHTVLSCTGYIIRGEAYTGNLQYKERPLLRFYKATGQQLMQYKSEETPIQTEKLLVKKASKKNKFLQYCNHLYENYSFNSPEILDFYLDKTILNPCIGVDKVIKTYAADVKHLMSKLPYYERTVSHAKTAIRMTNLFRDDKLEESWENSEDYAILQEARDVLGL